MTYQVYNTLVGNIIAFDVDIRVQTAIIFPGQNDTSEMSLLVYPTAYSMVGWDPSELAELGCR